MVGTRALQGRPRRSSEAGGERFGRHPAVRRSRRRTLRRTMAARGSTACGSRRAASGGSIRIHAVAAPVGAPPRWAGCRPLLSCRRRAPPGRRGSTRSFSSAPAPQPPSPSREPRWHPRPPRRPAPATRRRRAALAGRGARTRQRRPPADLTGRYALLRAGHQRTEGDGLLLSRASSWDCHRRAAPSPDRLDDRPWTPRRSADRRGGQAGLRRAAPTSDRRPEERGPWRGRATSSWYGDVLLTRRADVRLARRSCDDIPSVELDCCDRGRSAVLDRRSTSTR